jgi:hypothetical protein
MFPEPDDQTGVGDLQRMGGGSPSEQGQVMSTPPERYNQHDHRGEYAAEGGD